MEVLLRLLADGSLILILVVATPVVILWLRVSLWTKLPVLIIAGLTSLLVGKLLSLVYQPAVARPFMELGVGPGAAYIDNPGFPSDHALLAAAAVLAVYVATRNKRLTIALGLLTFAMCSARVLALVHTPLDVIFGLLSGVAGGVWYFKLLKK